MKEGFKDVLKKEGIILGVPFYSKLIGNMVCIISKKEKITPPENFSGIIFSEKALVDFRNVYHNISQVFKGSEVVEVSKDGLYEKIKKEAYSVLKENILNFHDNIRESFLNLEKREDIDFMVLMPYNEKGSVTQKLNLFKKQLGAFPYYTFFFKTQNPEMNLELIKTELAILNPKTIYCKINFNLPLTNKALDEEFKQELITNFNVKFI